MAKVEKARIKATIVGVHREVIVLDIGISDLELPVHRRDLIQKAAELYGKTAVVVVGTITEDNGNKVFSSVIDVIAPQEKP